MPNSKEILEHLDSALGGTFPKFKERFRVIAETEMYKAGEDESVWKQKKGLSKNSYETYMDGQFICSFTEDEGKTQTYIKVLGAIKDLIKSDKLFVNPEMYAVKDAEFAAKVKAEKEIVIPKAWTPEEKILVEGLRRQAKKKNRTLVEK